MPSEKIAAALEANGWSRAVAGEDFDRAVEALVKMYATGRGLFVSGDAGCGKTQLCRALQKMMHLGVLNWYYCKEPEDLAALRSKDGDAFGDTVFLDDIGSEEIVREYGNKIDIVGDFIQLYHYRGKGRFIANTNLHSSRYGKDGADVYGADQLNERYGGRILDRIFEMCVVLKLNGRTKRERIIV